MVFAYMIMILLLLIIFGYSYVSLFEYEKYKDIKAFEICRFICMAGLCYLGIMSAAQIFFHVMEGLHYFAVFFAAALIFVMPLIIRKHKSAVLPVLFKALTAALALEIIVFNFNAFQLSFKNYEYAELNFEEANITNMRSGGDSLFTSGSGEASLEFKNINTEIGTIEVRTNSQENKKVKINIDYSDATNREYRRNIASVEAVNGCDKSFIIPCNASGEIGSIKFRLTPENNDTVEIESIVINKPIAFKFSLIRIFLILFAALLKYMLCDAPAFKKSFEESRVLCIRCARFATVLFIAAAFALITFQRSEGLKNIAADFKATGGNQISQELVDAFENGSVSLLDEVPGELINLDNPYDWSQRDGISYKWDHLMYNGKYYSYYGIASVLFLFLPYHFITGYYFPTQWAVFLFGALGIYFLYKLYIEYISRFFKSLKISLVLSGLIMLETISGIWFCFPTTNFYEIAQTSGFMFCTSGFYFLLKSGVIGGGKLNNKILALSSVLFSLAVLSRPTLAVYCVCALVFIYGGFAKLKKQNAGNKKYVAYFASGLLPFVIIGLVQMIYNYARFGSFISFGIEYSLTINDFVNAEFHPHFMGISFWNALFALPSFSGKFPFITTTVETFNPNGYYFVANSTAIGLFVMALPMFSYFYGRKAYLISENSSKRFYALLIGMVCVLAPCIVIASSWESGYAARYKVDFACEMLTGALTIAFIIYGRCKNEGVKQLLTKIFFLSLAAAFILNFAQIYTFTINLGGFNHTALDKWFCIFERTFEFWR